MAKFRLLCELNQMREVATAGIGSRQALVVVHDGAPGWVAGLGTALIYGGVALAGCRVPAPWINALACARRGR